MEIDLVTYADYLARQSRWIEAAIGNFNTARQLCVQPGASTAEIDDCEAMAADLQKNLVDEEKQEEIAPSKDIIPSRVVIQG